MNKQKNERSMAIEMLNNVILISVNGPDRADFYAARVVDNWISSGKR